MQSCLLWGAQSKVGNDVSTCQTGILPGDIFEFQLWHLLLRDSAASVSVRQLEGVQTACKGRPRDEVTHIGVLRRKLAKSFNSLVRPNGNNSQQQRPVKPTASNLATNAQQLDTSVVDGPPAENENLARGKNPEAAAANMSRVRSTALLNTSPFSYG